jgi:polar amino acid transport system substrate-binding protein
LTLAAACGGERDAYDYRIGLDPSWYPLELLGQEPLVTGFSSDLIQGVAKKERLRLVRTLASWDNLLQGLEEGKYEGALTSMAPQVFTEDRYDFSEVYLLTGPVLIVPADSALASLDALVGKEVAVQGGSPGALLLERYPGVLIRYYDNIPTALNAVLTQEVDAAVFGVVPAEAYVRDLYKGRLKIATAPLNEEGLRLMVLHNKAPGLLRAFHAGLKSMRRDGKYAELLEKWSLAAESSSAGVGRSPSP